MEESVRNSSIRGSQKDVSMKSAQSSRRGRPKIPIQWSRVISFEDIQQYKTSAHEMDQDFKDLNENPLKPQRSNKKEWEILFNPKECCKDMMEKDLQSHQLK